MSAEIKLTNGKYTIIDEEDLPLLVSFNWRESAYGYAVNNTRQYMHRIIMGARNGELIDHINRIRLDNRKINLRFCDRSEHCQNKTKYKGGSKYWGVYWNKLTNSWRTRIQRNHHIFEGGLFAKEKEAAQKYDLLARQVYGPNARVNFPEGGD